MPAESPTAEFFRQAVAEAQRYGEDPWVFLRELGQNSRDAQAGKIQVHSEQKASEVILTFSDDGLGMTLEHARAYLFRLYASSKESEASSAGRFGVGFWSVLRFAPTRIEIHSRCESEAWGVGLRGDLDAWERIGCRRQKRGTSIVLARPLADRSVEDFEDELHRALVRYLAHLRTAGRKPRPLPVRFDGRVIERPFQLDGPGSLRFKEGPIEGVVGFGPRPAYVLYARGLPVLQGVFLDELQGQRTRARTPVEREGVAPVYLLNGDDLDVVLSRQSVVDNRALKELIRVARQRFEELVSRTIDGAVKSSWPRRGLQALGRALGVFTRGPLWMRLGTAVLGLLLVGGLLGLSVAWWGRGAGGESHEPLANTYNPKAPLAEVRSKALRFSQRDASPAPWIATHSPGDGGGLRAGTVIEGDSGSGWQLRYRSNKDLMFRQRLLDRYESGHGFQYSSERGPWFEPWRKRVLPAAVQIELRTGGRPGWHILPIPSGYMPVEGTGEIAGETVEIQVNNQGLARGQIPKGALDPLRYQVAPTSIWHAELNDLRDFMLRDPGAHLPPAFELRIRQIAKLPISERVAAAIALVQERMAYDRSAATAVEYARRLDGKHAWAEVVLDIGVGDCDVINGLLVLSLRKLGIPARLVAGFGGSEGRARAGVHAWVEVLQDEQLLVLDASLGARQLSTASVHPGTGSVSSLPADLGSVPSASIQAKPVGLEGNSGPLVAAMLILGALLAVIALLLTLATLGRSSDLAVINDDSKRRQLLAGMAADALKRPQAWRDVRGIWHRAYLPCLGGSAISLAKLVRLCKQDRAFSGSATVDLAVEAHSCGQVVLAADDPQFGRLYSLTAGLRDLDELARLYADDSERGLQLSFVRELDRLLRATRTGVLFRLSAGLEASIICRDVDLRPIRPGRRSAWPQRFVAIGSRSDWWGSLVLLFKQDPKLATVVAVDQLVADSRLLEPHAEQIRRLAARRALELDP